MTDAQKEQIAGLRDKIENAVAKLVTESGQSEGEMLFNTASEKVGRNYEHDLKPRRVLKGHFGKVYAIHWAGVGSGGEGEGDKLVSASQDGKLIVWNAHSMNKTMAIPLRSSWVMTCAFDWSNNGRVACGGLDNLCSIYKADDKGGDATPSKAQVELAHHDGYLSCCRFVNNEEILTSSGDSTCVLWDIASAQPKQTFNQHTSDVMSISVSPINPSLFVSGSCDASCMLWDMRTGAGTQRQFKGHESDINSVSFFPDGNCFGSGSDDSSCKIFDMRCFNQVGNFENDKILCGVTSICFAKSGRLLFAGYDDYTMGIWDTLGAARDVARVTSHDNRVSCIGTHCSGRAICTGSWDTILKCWA